MNNQHATAVEYKGIGVLLVGPPGCGKSELAFALMQRGAMLIADDQVLFEGKRATCPPALKGKIHLRDKGILAVPYRDATTIGIVFQSPLPAGPLSRPPALGVPVIEADFKDPQALTFIEKTLVKHLSVFDTASPSA